MWPRTQTGTSLEGHGKFKAFGVSRLGIVVMVVGRYPLVGYLDPSGKGGFFWGSPVLRADHIPGLPSQSLRKFSNYKPRETQKVKVASLHEMVPNVRCETIST